MRIFLALLLFLLILLSLLWEGDAYLTRWAEIPGPNVSGSLEVNIPSGVTGRKVCQLLAATKLIDHDWLFEIWARRQGIIGRFQSGRYRFTAASSPKEIASTLVQGRIYHEQVLTVTIPEGQSAKVTFSRLVNAGISAIDLETWFHDREFLQSLGVSSETLEGYLYPATYTFYNQMPSARQILESMVKKFFAQIDPALIQRLADKGLSLHQAVTFASLIELETAQESEKSMVAEVIWNRLRQGTALGIDAALIYGIKDYRGDIKWVHLKDEKNPYNTRLHKGLPPGPIGSPQRSSFLAILNPSQEGYYYYVMTLDSDRRHHFSKTLQEHNRYVDKLRKAR